MTTLHDGFSSETYDPVAAPFRGFRAFLIDDLEKRRPLPEGKPRGVVPDEAFESGAAANGAARRGSLRGIFMTDWVWGSGVNHARCMYESYTAMRVHNPAVIKADCDCGFWAYTNGDHYLSVGGPAALGVVEAWGRVVVGPDGFRAEKARIVGLCFPTPRPEQDDEVAEDSARVTRTNPLMAAFLAWSALLKGSRPEPTEQHQLAIQRAARPWEQVDDGLRADVRRLYPDVRIFDSVAQMQAEYPLSDLRGLLPEREAEGA